MDYISDRLDIQINWYDKKSIRCKKKYDCISMSILLLVATIPIINLIGAITNNFQSGFLIISSIMSGIVTVSFGYLKVSKSYELYKEYRRTCEKLKQEKVVFLTNTSDYYKLDDEDQKFNLFVERCESIMAHEHGNWAQLNEKIKEGVHVGGQA